MGSSYRTCPAQSEFRSTAIVVTRCPSRLALALRPDLLNQRNGGASHDMDTNRGCEVPLQLPRFVPARDRIAPIPSECPAAHAHARGRLAAFVLVALHQIQYSPYRGPVEAARRNLFHR